MGGITSLTAAGEVIIGEAGETIIILTVLQDTMAITEISIMAMATTEILIQQLQQQTQKELTTDQEEMVPEQHLQTEDQSLQGLKEPKMVP